jgi:hypothetical protein
MALIEDLIPCSQYNLIEATILKHHFPTFIRPYP